MSFDGGSPRGWDWISDPLLDSGEASSFYTPFTADPKVPGTVFDGLQHIWRTTDNGGPRAYLDQHCNEISGDFDQPCGDWKPMGGERRRRPVRGGDPSNYVVAVERAPATTAPCGRARGAAGSTSRQTPTPPTRRGHVQALRQEARAAAAVPVRHLGRPGEAEPRLHLLLRLLGVLARRSRVRGDGQPDDRDGHGQGPQRQPRRPADHRRGPGAVDRLAVRLDGLRRGHPGRGLGTAGWRRPACRRWRSTG